MMRARRCCHIFGISDSFLCQHARYAAALCHLILFLSLLQVTDALSNVLTVLGPGDFLGEMQVPVALECWRILLSRCIVCLKLESSGLQHDGSSSPASCIGVIGVETTV